MGNEDVRDTALGPFMGSPWALLAFAAGHVLLVMLGHGLKVPFVDPAVMWPAAGLALCWYWLAPVRLWPGLVLVQFAVEFGAASLWTRPFSPGLAGLHGLASLAGAMIGAGIGRLSVPVRVSVRTRHLVWFLVASAVGSLVNALIGSTANLRVYGDAAAAGAWLQDLQIWWAGNWLGCLAVAPVLVMWSSPLRHQHPELALRSRAELACVATALALVSVMVFWTLPSGKSSLLQTPAIVAVVLLYSAVCLPPRWTAVLSAAAMVLCAWSMAHGRGPFQAPDIFDRTAEAQTYLATISIGSIAMAVLMAEKSIAMARLRQSVTELAALNERLRHEQQRLTVYARQLITAEERARRSTAVDLHDGMGQLLAGIGITLGLARQHTTTDGDALVAEAVARLSEVQERTRHMISDLSPPGLYDLGLTPALQWLVVYLKKHDDLQVELDLDLREDAVKLDTRVLVFKLVRELLRNVIKHAGVKAARVQVRDDGKQLVVEVSDRGRGFNWQEDALGARDGGFGLWSIAGRVSEVGGEFKVDSASGRGSCFVVILPLLQGEAATA